MAGLIQAVALLVLVSVAHGETYENPDHGVRLVPPTGVKVCYSIPHHGIEFLLHSSGCDHEERHARIEVFFYYNVISFSKATSGLSEEVCGNTTSGPMHLKTAGRTWYRCRGTKAGHFFVDKYFLLRPLYAPDDESMAFEITAMRTGGPNAL